MGFAAREALEPLSGQRLGHGMPPGPRRDGGVVAGEGGDVAGVEVGPGAEKAAVAAGVARDDLLPALGRRVADAFDAVLEEDEADLVPRSGAGEIGAEHLRRGIHGEREPERHQAGAERPGGLDHHE
jgi:hypothetical protein